MKDRNLVDKVSLAEDIRAEGEPEKEFNPGIAERIPRKTVAGGALIRDRDGLILFLEPTYKPTLEIPGGIANANESPLQACRREVREEIGIDVDISGTLVVDWIPESGPWHDGVMFIFDGGVLDEEAIGKIRLDPSEARSCHFLPLEAAMQRLRPSMARRLAIAQAAATTKTTIYTEFGRQP